MTPKVRSHYDLELLYALGDGELSDTASKNNKNEYEKWLDIEDEGLRPPSKLESLES